KPDEYETEDIEMIIKSKKVEVSNLQSELDKILNNSRESDLTPYLNKIILGDCTEYLSKLPKNSVHMFLSDIPYGINLDEWDVLHNNTNSALLGASPAQEGKSA